MSLVLLIFSPNFVQLKQTEKVERALPKLNRFEMISVRGGTFLMGGFDLAVDGGPIETEPERGDECPHYVTIKDFYIGKYEVTQVEWEEIRGDNPSYFKVNDKNQVEQVCIHKRSGC